MARKEDRFKVEFKEGGMMTRKTIFVDQKTGVNYLFVSEGYSGGLCPILDRDGKPVVTSVNCYEEL